jgi:uncharacterized protein
MHDHIIKSTADHVKALFANDGSGHDWWHIYRVWRMAVQLSTSYPDTDHTVVQLAALLHDIADWKYHDGDHEIGPARAMAWCQQFDDLSPAQIEHIGDIISKVSFKGAGATLPDMTLEGQIVQDADRLDAIGAIGIARTFAYGGHKGQLMYDPSILPITDESTDSYTSKDKVGTTVNHFYEKLLLLKDRINTEAGKAMAAERHAYMQSFLKRFYAEWVVDG